jgi:hypothetical protein
MFARALKLFSILFLKTTSLQLRNLDHNTMKVQLQMLVQNRQLYLFHVKLKIEVALCSASSSSLPQKIFFNYNYSLIRAEKHFLKMHFVICTSLAFGC